MARHEIRIGSVVIESKTKAKSAVKEMLNKYNHGEQVSPADHQFLRDLLLLHPDPGKNVQDVAYFKLGKPTDQKANFRSRCFVIVRTDGSEEDFGTFKCIDNAPLAKAEPN